MEDGSTPTEMEATVTAPAPAAASTSAGPKKLDGAVKGKLTYGLDVLGAFVGLLGIATGTPAACMRRLRLWAGTRAACRVMTRRRRSFVGAARSRAGAAAIINMVAVGNVDFGVGSFAIPAFTIPFTCDQSPYPPASVLGCLTAVINIRWQVGVFSFMIMCASKRPSVQAPRRAA